MLFTCWFAFSQACSGAVALQLGHNVVGATYGVNSFEVPPDAGVAVGPNHVVEFINGRFTVFTKTNLTMVQLQTKTDVAFWTAAGVSYSGLVSDPRILFDPDSQRWFAAMVDVPASGGANHFLLAVSTNSDPTGPWSGTSWLADPINSYFADFPTLGIDTKGVYLSGDMFSGNNQVGALLASIPKADLLSNAGNIGGLSSSGLISAATYGSVLQPAVTLGPASTAEAVLAIGNLGYDFQPHSTLMSFTVQNADAENGATLSNALTLTVPAYSVPINPPQPGGADNLDNGDGRISAMVYRVGDTLYAVHGTQVDGRAAIQWFVVDAPSQTLSDTGLITDTNLDLFYAAICANTSGSVVIVYNGCSTNTYISSYGIAAERINGTLVFGNPVLLQAGAAPYRVSNPSATSRWGDYSAISPDPLDPSRFWSLTLYPSSTSAWSTELSELILAPLTLTISPAGTNVLVCWPASVASYQLQFSTTLAPANWMTVTGPGPVVTNNQWCVTLPSGSGTTFFRLIH